MSQRHSEQEPDKERLLLPRRATSLAEASSEYDKAIHETQNAIASVSTQLARPKQVLRYVKEGQKKFEKARKALGMLVLAVSLEESKNTEASEARDAKGSSHGERKSKSRHLSRRSDANKDSKRATKAFEDAVNALEDVKRRHYEMASANFGLSLRSAHDEKADAAMDKFFEDACYLLYSRSVRHSDTASQYWKQLAEKLETNCKHCDGINGKLTDEKLKFRKEHKSKKFETQNPADAELMTHKVNEIKQSVAGIAEELMRRHDALKETQDAMSRLRVEAEQEKTTADKAT
ncbi:uncharacterized protein FOMMEDRAFT_160706 [Fomitiporia mediterranea MF3/22]|uniref:uncharacterized protein n=1 Tax=Fomitiporia mediterranea (strain MF3/22) TaxID=694068 RepID=UPI0004407607|nr:uncharacterized protein FOMMEDRAFT_160706 [Fomitiporia mediterranea MF3/22]EJC99140.1 hypothetical protein FOMMEDRAFT_160706 [Fomitiporia mediterranea MF3/22]